MDESGITERSFQGVRCPPHPDSADATPPSFAQAIVRLEPLGTTQVRGEFELNGPDDIIRFEIGSDLGLRVIATAGDPESGIANISIQSVLGWRCKLGAHSEVIGVMETAPIAFEAFSQPASPITPMQINVLSNPVAQTGCERTAGKGPNGAGRIVRRHDEDVLAAVAGRAGARSLLVDVRRVFELGHTHHVVLPIQRWFFLCRIVPRRLSQKQAFPVAL
jgi:hypothetical protein